MHNLAVCADRTPTHNTLLCSAVCSQARNAHTTRLAQEFHIIFVRQKESSHLVCCMSHPWLSHLPFTTSTSSSSFTLPPTTQEHAARSVQQEQHREHSAHIPHISKLPPSTSCATKNHSGVKTCRVADTRAPQLPQKDQDTKFSS